MKIWVYFQAYKNQEVGKNEKNLKLEKKIEKKNWFGKKNRLWYRYRNWTFPLLKPGFGRTLHAELYSFPFLAITNTIFVPYSYISLLKKSKKLKLNQQTLIKHLKLYKARIDCNPKKSFATTSNLCVVFMWTYLHK